MNRLSKLLSSVLSVSLSIRMKILILIGFALGTSLLSYIGLGTSLIVEDKASYIYEFNLAQVKSASDHIESQIHRVHAALTMMGRLVNTGGDPASVKALAYFFQQQQQALANRGLMVLRPASTSKFDLQTAFSQDHAELQTALAQAGWTPALFEKKELLAVTAGPGKLLVGIRGRDNMGGPVVLVTAIELKSDLFRNEIKNYKVHIVDSAVQPVAGSAEFYQGLQAEKVREFESTLLKSEFPSGAKDWNDGSEDYIVAYERIASAPLMVVGFVSKKESFRAAETLVKRSGVLGVSILLLAVAITLLLARTLSQRLKQLGAVAQSVGDGDFSVRVDVTKGNDEITGLGRTFNTMAGRISELMAETAEKARMGKELETAQAVQKTFFPTKGFVNDNLRVSGKALPASECAGDWWQYSHFGKYLVVSVGDVTGHGVSSALVTAAAFAAYSIAVKEVQASFEANAEAPAVEKLLTYLNTAVRAAGGGTIDMTTVLSVIDLETGMMRVMNAAHRPPYVYRKPAGVDLDAQPAKAFMPLIAPAGRPIGSDELFIPKPLELQLKPGDVVFWYTDGLLECKNEQGDPMKKPVLMRALATAVQSSEGNADGICNRVLDDFATFLGKNAKNLEDDVTLAVAVVPSDAKFSARA